MADSNIEWTDKTWNPVTGCTWASPGCDNCYAVKMTRRLEAMGQEKYAGLTTHKHFNGVVKTHADVLTLPLTWKKPKRIFVNSMSDLFHRDVPFEFIIQVLNVCRASQQHTYQILTKRPEQAALFYDKFPCFANIPNVWLGTSCEDQQRADERIPWLLKCPAAVRFLSMEPLLGSVNLAGALNDCRCGECSFCNEVAYNKTASVDWVIVGGESGHGARPMHPDWVRSIRDQCQAAGVPVFVKQLGSNCGEKSYEPGARIVDQERDPKIIRDKKGGDWSEWPEDLRVREFPEVAANAS